MAKGDWNRAKKHTGPWLRSTTRENMGIAPLVTVSFVFVLFCLLRALPIPSSLKDYLKGPVWGEKVGFIWESP